MPILGGRVERLEAKKLKDETISEMRLDLLIDTVEQDKKLLRVKYTSTMHYEPGVGEITVAGQLFWEVEDEKKAKAVSEEYQKTRRLPNDIAEEIVTAVSYTNAAVGTLAAFGLGLSAPINTPRARITPAQAPSGNLRNPAAGGAGAS